jgi:hypothetical protein
MIVSKKFAGGFFTPKKAILLQKSVFAIGLNKGLYKLLNFLAKKEE